MLQHEIRAAAAAARAARGSRPRRRGPPKRGAHVRARAQRAIAHNTLQPRCPLVLFVRQGSRSIKVAVPGPCVALYKGASALRAGWLFVTHCRWLAKMLLKIAHHGARVLTLVTGFGLMAVLLVPGLTGDASVTLTSMHVRAAVCCHPDSGRQLLAGGALLPPTAHGPRLPYRAPSTRAAFPHGFFLCRAVVAGCDDVRHRFWRKGAWRAQPSPAAAAAASAQHARRDTFPPRPSSYLQLNRVFPNRAARRLLHGVLQVRQAALGCSGTGGARRRTALHHPFSPLFLRSWARRCSRCSRF